MLNNTVFKYDKCSPIFILEVAENNAYETYNKRNNSPICPQIARSNPLDTDDTYNKINWIPSPIDWIKI